MGLRQPNHTLQLPSRKRNSFISTILPPGPSHPRVRFNQFIRSFVRDDWVTFVPRVVDVFAEELDILELKKYDQLSWARCDSTGLVIHIPETFPLVILDYRQHTVPLNVAPAVDHLARSACQE